jgi:Flp pilus assembly pilin Flp
MQRALATLHKDESGATVVEFAMIAPVLLVTLMGLFDFSYNIYAESMIEGAVQKAARDSTIEQFANNPAALDAHVREAVQSIVPSADVTFDRSAYSNYLDVGLAEDFTDTNEDGACNAGEPFVDYNGNGFWDDDRALEENGGARDAVLYEVTATYDRAFPLAGLLGFEATTSVAARTVLRNQPFSAQSEPTATGNCPL